MIEHNTHQHTIFSQTNTGNIFGRQKSATLFMSSLVKKFPQTLTHTQMRKSKCKTSDTYIIYMLVNVSKAFHRNQDISIAKIPIVFKIDKKQRKDKR